MNRLGTVLLVALAVGLAAGPADGQFVLRDDVDGWGWLALTPTNRAVVQLASASLETGEQGRLDRRVLDDLRSMGVRRTWGADDFEPTENQVVAECAAVDWTPPGAPDAVYGLHLEVSYWDHTRLAATEIYEAITLDQIASTDLASDTFVDTCVSQLSDVLIRLGFDEG